MFTARSVLLGVIAGALSVLIFHQGMYYLLATSRMGVSGEPWRTEMVPLWSDLMRTLGYPPFNVPLIVRQMIWGSLWGGLFGLIVARIPKGPAWIKGLFFALVFPMLIGSWLIIPLIEGAPILNGYLDHRNHMRLRTGFLLNGLAFGLGLGIIYGLLAARRSEAYA
jgi:hypothetical protein